MNQKPADYFIGMVDFFAIILPGALLVFLFLDWGAQLFGTVLPSLGTAAEQWAAFVVASYISGHILHHAGSVLDRLYDSLYVKHWKRRKGKEKLLERAEFLKEQQLGADSSMTSTFSWAGSFVRANSSAAAGELDRSGAESKFFRSLTLVLLAACLVFWGRAAPAMAIVGTVGLLLFAFWRFCLRRWQGSQLAYEYYVLLSLPVSGSQTAGSSQSLAPPVSAPLELEGEPKARC